MLDKFAWWLCKKCILILDRHNDVMAFSFAKDNVTDFHVMAERFLPDKHLFGMTEEPYREDGEA